MKRLAISRLSFPGVVVLSAFAAMAGTTDARVISETETFGFGDVLTVQASGEAPKSNSGSQFRSSTETFDQFDPSLGTLAGVRFILTSAVERFVTVSAAASGAGPVAAEGDLDLFVRLAFPSGPIAGPLFARHFTVAADCRSLFSSCSDSDGTDGLYSDTFDVNPADFPGFIGLGTFSPALFKDLDVGVDLTVGFALATAQGVGGWRGGVTVEYTFTEHQAVPEPGTLALMGTGLTGLGLLRRRMITR